MTDRVSATIRIGGAIRSDLIEPLIDAIEGDHGMLDWIGKTVDASDFVDGATLEICAHGLIGGQFDQVEDFCNQHRIPYVRNSDPCVGAFSAQHAVHTGDGAPRYYGTNESERVVMTRAELNELGTIAAANAWFQAAAFSPPAISIIAPTDDPEPWAAHQDHALGDWKYEVSNDDTRLGYLDWVAAREGAEGGDVEAAAIAPVPEATGLYLHLYHGRKDPDEDLEDWGSDGPVIGPLAYVHTTYMCDIKFAAAPDVMDRFFPAVMADWRERGLSNVAGPQCDWRLTIFNDYVEYDGVYYGDWTVFAATSAEVEERFAKAAEAA
ncbi:MAG: hypothetical protein CVT74_08935 [Alphaproteobacteria bacterium HGW-Alphaproteobacteria-13]|nr:MAG: hypothetical protein CVT74_08935 [Alphaproteobacteria bacterium HGW-Alphaproteobacteria-13]